MHSRTWKRAESEIAALLGGERVPVTGRGRGDMPDIMHDRLAIEVKAVGQGKAPYITRRIKEALGQAQAASDCLFQRDRTPRAPVLVVQQTTDSRRLERYVVMEFDDFCDLTGIGDEEVGTAS